MSSRTIDAVREDVRHSAERYLTTVHALLAFSAYVVHDGSRLREDAFFGFGRRMDTSSENLIEPDSQVTPDLVAQKSPAYGIAGEVKAGFHANEREWDSRILRLKKYDDELVGWWTDTEEIALADAVILVDQSKARPFVRYLRKSVEEGNELREESTAVIEFSRSDNLEVFIFFRREWGNIRDADLAPRLDDGISIPIRRVLQTFPSVQFYDARPPIQWLMEMLWVDSFAARQDPDGYDEAKKAWPILVSVDELTEELQKAYGSKALHVDERSCEFPKPRWIRDALDQFVKIKYAVPDADNNGTFTVLFRPIRGDVLGRFVELLERTKPQKEPPAEGQTRLALDDDQ